VLPFAGALQKTGAITLVGTENVRVADNLMTRLDGTAIFIGSYNRNVTIERNEFSLSEDLQWLHGAIRLQLFLPPRRHLFCGPSARTDVVARSHGV
jgi:hypothetical protein